MIIYQNKNDWMRNVLKMLAWTSLFDKENQLWLKTVI